MLRPACPYTRRMHWLGRLGCSLGTVLLLGACPAPEDEGGDDIESGRTTHAPPTTSATSSGDSATTDDTATGSVTTSATSAGSSGGDTTGAPTTGIQPPFFDLGVPDSPKFDMGCRKVDFLFVIDNSGSMSAQQAQLLASFNGFITAIQDSLDESVDSYHVGVITSDAYSSNAPGCNTLGALVSQTQAGGDCTPFAAGGRYALVREAESCSRPSRSSDSLSLRRLQFPLQPPPRFPMMPRSTARTSSWRSRSWNELAHSIAST